MSILPKLFRVGVPILLLLLTALAGYAYSKIQFLSLPISQTLGIFAVLLPIISGLSTYGAGSLIRKSPGNDQYQLTLPFISAIGLQLIYETVVATLALTHVLPPSALACGLDRGWARMFSDKNALAIRAIQDTFNCCGLNSIYDRSWPFKGNAHDPGNCAEAFGRTTSCLQQWRQAEQINAGIFLLVAVIVFTLKLLSLTVMIVSPSWTQAAWARSFQSFATGDSDDPRATMRRLIEEGAGQEYRDEIGVESSAAAQDVPGGSGPNHGPRVMPSQLMDPENQWRDEEGGHRG